MAIQGGAAWIAATQMEAEQRRANCPRRSQATIQTTVDNAVVQLLGTAEGEDEKWSHFQKQQHAVEKAIRAIEKERRELFMRDKVSWTAHWLLYRDWIVVVCLALKFSVHEFERTRFQRLLLQHCCAGACELGLVLSTIMDSNMHSGVYCLFSLGNRMTYWGKWHGSLSRSNRERYEEHMKATLQAKVGLNTEHKYIYMSVHGGAAKWWSLPMIAITGPISKTQLNKIERAEYTKDPRTLNKSGVVGRKRTVSRSSARLPYRDGKPKPAQPRAVIAQLFGIYKGSPQMGHQLFGDVEAMVETCDTFWWHSSRPIDWVSVIRKWGKSVVELAYDSFSASMKKSCGIMPLSSALRKPELRGWCQITIMHRFQHTPSRSEAYLDLLTIAKHDYGSGQQIYNTLTIEELWRLWKISEVSCTSRVHQKNRKHIGRALRLRTCRFTPDTRLVYRVPPGIEATKREILASLRRSLKKSFVHLTITDHLLHHVEIRRGVAPTLKTLLDTHGQAIRDLHELGHLPCACHLYPSLPERHGHKFMPSWECDGQVGHEILSKAMSSRTVMERDSRLMARTTDTFLHRWFPDRLLDASVFQYLAKEKRGNIRDCNFTRSQVMQVKQHYRYLVGAVIDKAPGRLLYVCPEFYEKRYYNLTFPVRDEPGRYLPTGKSSEDVVGEKATVFFQQKWDRLATLLPDGDIAMPYVLPKLKDILADCNEMVEKKGKCCRARPIIPYTFDQWRRLYKKVGKILLYIENRIPRNRCAIVSNTAQVVLSISEGVEKATSKYKQTPFRWMLEVGDVANMYDELDHQSVDMAMDWLLDNAGTWLHRRARKTMGFSVTPWGFVTEGRSEGDNKEVYIDLQMIRSIGRLDNKYCQLIDRGEVFSKKLGCPMGGFLSPRKANTTLAQSEWDIFELAEGLGLVMVLVRYMDDVMCAIAYASQEEKTLAQCIFTLLKGTYPYPLDLQWEPRSNRQAFLEMEVLTVGSRLWCRYKAKVKKAIESGDRSFARVPSGLDGHSTLDRYRYFRNTIIRICSCCTNPWDVYQSVVFVAMEMLMARWSKSEVCATIQSVASQSRTKEMESYALLQAKAMVGWIM